MTEDEQELLLVRTKQDAERLAKKLGIKWRQVYNRRKELIMYQRVKVAIGEKTDIDENIRKRILNQKETFVEELSNQFDVGIKHILDLARQLEKEGYLINLTGQNIQLANSIQPPEPTKIPIEPFFGNWIKFGVVSDTHLNSKYERLDVLNALYDIYAEEGVKTVLHGGNIIEGYNSKLNQFDVINTGVDEQVEYCIKNYPQRKDITTHFITADDHEGWFVKQNHVNIGKVIENTAIEEGREDLHHLGYIEADVEINIGERPTIIRIMHPGGGSAYAKSYKPQKIIESFAGGEKPDFLIIGHYHKSGWDVIRNVPYVCAGCTADQSPFVRKTPIQVNIGGYIVELRIDNAGNVRRIRPEWFIFYNKGFYQQEIKKEYQKAWEYKW